MGCVTLLLIMSCNREIVVCKHLQPLEGDIMNSINYFIITIIIISIIIIIIISIIININVINTTTINVINTTTIIIIIIDTFIIYVDLWQISFLSTILNGISAVTISQMSTAKENTSTDLL